MAAAGAFSACAQPRPATPDSWVGVGGGPEHTALVLRALPTSLEPSWNQSEDETGATIRFQGSSGLAVSDASMGSLVFAVGRVTRPGEPPNQARLFAIERNTGMAKWSTPVTSFTLDSWSQPALDPVNAAVVFASGRFVVALDALSGATRWVRQLTRSVVNASPVVTTDLGPADRAFITDFQGGGTSGRLYCINVDPFDPALNPYNPGDIVWSVVVGGTSGNTPAYSAGVVYLATNGQYFTPPTPSIPGLILAFPAAATSPPAPLWTFTNVQPLGFYGGVAVVRSPSAGMPPNIYAASYNFATSGNLHSSNLVKLDGNTGQMVWTTPCGRSSTIPVALPDGRIVLSEGVRGEFGSAAAVSMFVDSGFGAGLLWNSALATWDDANMDQVIQEGEYEPVGGWSLQPVVSQFGGRTFITVGVLPSESNHPPDSLLILDADRSPTDPGFVVTSLHGAGNSAAIAGSSIYSAGEDGLFTLGPTTAQLDLNDDSVISIDDLYAWEQGQGELDINKDGVVDARDRTSLLTLIRCLPVSRTEGL